MEIRELESFAEVYRTENITNAARNLFLSQQAVSKSIKSLENKFGFQLFTRTKLGAQPTEEAKKIYPDVRNILALYSTINENVSIIRSKHMQSVRISSIFGLHSGIDGFSFLKMGDKLRNENFIDPIFTSKSGALAVESVISGEDDLALIVHHDSIRDNNLQYYPIRTLAPYFIIPKDDPINAKPSLNIEDLKNLTPLAAQGDIVCKETILALYRDAEASYEPDFYEHPRLDFIFSELISIPNNTIIAWKGFLELVALPENNIKMYPSPGVLTMSIIVNKHALQDGLAPRVAKTIDVFREVCSNL